MCTCDLATVLGVTESAVSQHLRVLRSLRLVRPRRDGRIVFYTLDDKHVARLVQLGLAHLERDNLLAAQRWLTGAKHLDPSDRRVDLALQQLALRKKGGRRRKRAA
jgi:hypothetical protein